MRRVLVVVFLLAVHVLPTNVLAASHWTRLRSPNFTFIGDASEGEIRRIAQQLEQFREVMLRALPRADSTSPVPTVVMVFATDRTFEPFKPKYQGRTIELAGYFQGSEDVNYIAVNADLNGSALRTVLHEYSHFLIGNSLGLVPVWMNEGLAQLYDTFEERDGGKAALIGRAPSEHVQLLASSTLIPLLQLMAVDHASPLYNEGSRRGLFYAESWALTHYLTFGNATRAPQFANYLTRVRNGASAEQALREAFLTDPPALERELQEYVRKFTFPAVKFTFDTKVSAVVTARGEELSDAEAQGYLGDLLARIDRVDDARTYLEKTIAVNRDAARAMAALGLLELRASHLDRALPLLERAVTLAPDDGAVNSALGRALIERLRHGTDDGTATTILQRARSALARSAELEPDVAHTTAMLGLVETIANDDPARAVTLLRRAVTLAPAREQYRFMLAEALVRQGDYKSATDYLGELLARGSGEQIRDQARRDLARVAQLRTLTGVREAAAANREPLNPERLSRTPSPGALLPTPFIPALRVTGSGETRTAGIFRSIECPPGTVVLVIQTAAGVIHLAARQITDVEFISYRDDTPKTVNCGPLATSMPVLATYRAASPGASDVDGSAVALELVPDGFVAK